MLAWQLNTPRVDLSEGQFVLCVAHALLGIGFWPLWGQVQGSVWMAEQSPVISLDVFLHPGL